MTGEVFGSGSNVVMFIVLYSDLNFYLGDSGHFSFTYVHVYWVGHVGLYLFLNWEVVSSSL